MGRLERFPGWNFDTRVHPVLINFQYVYFLHLLPMGGKKNSLQWIYNPTDDSVCLFVCFTDRLANFKSQDIKIFRHAQYPDDYGLVQPVGPRLVQ